MRRFIARLLGFTVDWMVLFAALALPQFAIMTVTGQWFLDQDSTAIQMWAWVGLSVTLPSYAYFVLSDRSTSGMTIGKRITNVSVRSVNGSRVSWRQSLVRNAVKLLPWEATHIMIFFPEPFGENLSTGKSALMVIANMLLVVWLVIPLLDRPGYRAMHDRVAGTRVVSG